MIESTSTIQHLRSLPWSERHDVLESIVVGEFRATLLMDDEEELPMDESYFDLGFTSLRIAEIKQRLDGLLGCDISTNMLFNTPTVERLLAHLTGDLLAELFRADEPAAEPAGSAPAPHRNPTNGTGEP